MNCSNARNTAINKITVFAFLYRVARFSKQKYRMPVKFDFQINSDFVCVCVCV
jgi:hypothetical protein